jgi:hypothetical protein
MIRLAGVSRARRPVWLIELMEKEDGHSRVAAMTPLEFKNLQRDLLALDDCDLSDWERTFVDDMMARADKYGSGTRLSGLQTSKIEQMKEKHNV